MNDIENIAVADWMSQLLTKRFGAGLEVHLSQTHWTISMQGNSRKILIKRNSSFYSVKHTDLPCGLCLDTQLPAPGEMSNKLACWSQKAQSIEAKYDILGFVYWSLTRSEELGAPPSSFDKYGRFMSRSSHAAKHDYLERPLADEWLQSLFEQITALWPSFEGQEHHYSIELSHDVDNVLRYGSIPPSLFLKKVLRPNSDEGLFRFLSAPVTYLLQNVYLSPTDPENTFDWIMQTSEKFGVKSTFFFISCNDVHEVDNRYPFTCRAVKNLLKKIIGRGHQVGLHPSLGSTFVEDRIRFENKVLADQSIPLSFTPLSARMHYLQWQAWDTVKELAKAGIQQDWSLGYADRAGFRAGTCHTYEAFDPVKYQPLGVEMHPLIVMDRTLTSPKYMNLNQAEAEHLVEKLANLCHKVSGNISLLWHNSQLATQDQKDFYVRLLKSCEK